MQKVPHHGQKVANVAARCLSATALTKRFEPPQNQALEPSTAVYALPACILR